MVKEQLKNAIANDRVPGQVAAGHSSGQTDQVLLGHPDATTKRAEGLNPHRHHLRQHFFLGQPAVLVNTHHPPPHPACSPYDPLDPAQNQGVDQGPARLGDVLEIITNDVCGQCHIGICGIGRRRRLL